MFKIKISAQWCATVFLYLVNFLCTLFRLSTSCILLFFSSSHIRWKMYVYSKHQNHNFPSENSIQGWKSLFFVNFVSLRCFYVIHTMSKTKRKITLVKMFRWTFMFMSQHLINISYLFGMWCYGRRRRVCSKRMLYN